MNLATSPKLLNHSSSWKLQGILSYLNSYLDFCFILLPKFEYPHILYLNIDLLHHCHTNHYIVLIIDFHHCHYQIHLPQIYIAINNALPGIFHFNVVNYILKELHINH